MKLIANNSVELSDAVQRSIEHMYDKIQPYQIETYITSDFELCIILRGREFLSEIPVAEDEWHPLYES